MARSVRKRTREKPEARRQQILDAAIRAFGQRGYHGFTVRELAQQCGLSNAGLLHYFPSKDELLAAALQAMEQRELTALAPFVARIEQERARGGVSLQAYLDFVHAIVARVSSYPEFARLYAVLQSESLDEAHPAHDSFRRRESVTLDRFAEMVAPYVAEPRSTARHLVALQDGLRQQWLRAERKFDVVAEWVRAVTALVPQLTKARGQHATAPRRAAAAVRRRQLPKPTPLRRRASDARRTP